MVHCSVKKINFLRKAEQADNDNEVSRALISLFWLENIIDRCTFIRFMVIPPGIQLAGLT